MHTAPALPPSLAPSLPPSPAATLPSARAVPPGKAESALLEKARALEAAFLSEMLGHAGLGHAGLGESGGAFGGGIGEAQFASFLRQEQANLMVQRGGIGLAEQLFRAMRGDRA